VTILPTKCCRIDITTCWGKGLKLNPLFLEGRPLLHSVDLHEAPRVTDMDSQEVDLPKVEVVMVMATAVTMPVRKTMPVPTILGV
jgi:hypothetical protein